MEYHREIRIIRLSRPSGQHSITGLLPFLYSGNSRLLLYKELHERCLVFRESYTGIRDEYEEENKIFSEVE